MTPAVKLNTGSPWIKISLMKIPIAAPIPPDKGPKRTATIAGMITGGQNLTTPIPGAVIGSARYVIYPNIPYKAPQIPLIAISNVFKCYAPISLPNVCYKISFMYELHKFSNEV